MILRAAYPDDPSRLLGDIRLVLRPEWSSTSETFAKQVALQQTPSSTVYRLEPGFLIQGRLSAPSVRPNSEKPRAPKVMERGEVGWAGGSAGPDYFIYLGTGVCTSNAQASERNWVMD